MNPFEVLRLDPSSSEEEVVKQAARLRRCAADEAERIALQQAVQALTGRPEERLLHSLLTHPRPGHTASALERFAAAHRRPPTPVGEPPAPPAVNLKEFADLLRVVVAEELDLKPLPFEAMPAEEDANEVSRRTAEALWQSLLFDMRA